MESHGYKTVPVVKLRANISGVYFIFSTSQVAHPRPWRDSCREHSDQARSVTRAEIRCVASFGLFGNECIISRGEQKQKRSHEQNNRRLYWRLAWKQREESQTKDDAKRKRQRDISGSLIAQCVLGSACDSHSQAYDGGHTQGTKENHCDDGHQRENQYPDR